MRDVTKWLYGDRELGDPGSGLSLSKCWICSSVSEKICASPRDVLWLIQTLTYLQGSKHHWRNFPAVSVLQSTELHYYSGYIYMDCSNLTI